MLAFHLAQGARALTGRPSDGLFLSAKGPIRCGRCCCRCKGAHTLDPGWPRAPFTDLSPDHPRHTAQTDSLETPAARLVSQKNAAKSLIHRDKAAVYLHQPDHAVAAPIGAAAATMVCRAAVRPVASLRPPSTGAGSRRGRQGAQALMSPCSRPGPLPASRRASTWKPVPGRLADRGSVAPSRRVVAT